MKEKRDKIEEEFYKMFGKYPTEYEKGQFLQNRMKTFEMSKDENSRVKDLL